MKKDKILQEMDRIIFEGDGHVSFRAISSNLGIAPSTISYQFQNQSNLYTEYLRFKLKQLITTETLASFEKLMFEFGHQTYIIFRATSNEITFDMVGILIRSVLIKNFEIIDLIFKQDYGYIDREKELAIISNIIIAMVFPDNYSIILNNDLTTKENRERLIGNLIKREVE